jgi:ribosomal-protein-serine acetyltransferase
MFSYKLSENTEVRLLEERHAQQLTDLTERNREHLREWLPWVDTNRTLEDRKNFIRGALKQFAQGQRSEGSPNGCTATGRVRFGTQRT